MRKTNAAVDEAQAVTGRFNTELRVYNESRKSKKAADDASESNAAAQSGAQWTVWRDRLAYAMAYAGFLR